MSFFLVASWLHDNGLEQTQTKNEVFTIIPESLTLKWEIVVEIFI